LKWSLWKDFHAKASGFLFRIVVPLKSTVGFVSNLKKSYFKRCKRFSQNFSIIGVTVRELHLPEVEGVETIYVCSSNLVKIVLSSKA
jgi:hypothetical protein